MSQFKTKQEIMQAVLDGRTVYWKRSNYWVIIDSKGQYLIQYAGGDVVGLAAESDCSNFYTLENN